MKIWAFPSIYPYDSSPKHRSTGIFAHRQFKSMVQNGAELAVIQPVNWHPGKMISKLHPEWKSAAEINYPVKRMQDGVQVFHPRVRNLKPSYIFSNSYVDRYVNAIEKFFHANKIQLHPDDIFYSQWIPEAYNVKHAAKKMGVRFAIKVIGDDVLVLPHHQKGYVDVMKEVWGGADIRLTVADYLANEANRLIGEDLKYHTVRRGTDYDFFKPVSNQEKLQLRKELDIPADKLVILCIGSAIVAKGWLDLFEALKGLKESGADFLLVGVHGGIAHLNLPEEASKFGLSCHFKEFRDIKPSAINRFYNIADVFCLASHSEGIANVVVEAMASALPVIATNVSGHPELIKGRDTGILIPPHKPTVMCAELVAMIQNADLREQTGRQAREFIIKEWGSVDYNAHKLYEILSHKAEH
jgi:teichuronic acid biosynthesis glycosyltransferase TuaC